ncbi:hypothetical protein RRF57_008482 [Xylaria bambusicola]|uniref:Nephrocystin 3-like N-terminal domain-containing protein n=1 Tax=Xylaria bambusicola TaxID=326684 RepID=A0AAN7ZBG4_9PEZI
MMNTREDQIDSQKKGVAPQSFDWVWSTTFRKWLVGSFGSSVPFWIAGKPGSGKSTLMKYLVDNKKTRQLLTKVDKNFSIISFFFDYRAGESTANNCIGVLKMFMKQLCDLNPKLEVNLASENVKTPIGKMSEVRLIKLFAKALRSTIGQTWAFIDGLDEYSGDYTELVLFFQELQSQTPINLCLASRPEAVFQSRFKEYPHFVMQDYNHKSIRAYCTYAIQAAQDQLMNCEALRNPQVREAIVQKAQGVIIRARFAVDTLLHENPHDVSAATLEAFIDRLPEDLEQMYTGTLKRLSQNMASKAALILYLIT